MALRESDNSPSRRRFTDGTQTFATVIGSGVEFKGEVRGATNLEIRGKVEGKVELDGLLWLRDGGKVVGELAATNVVVEGELKGNIQATEKVDLRDCCRVVGDITAATIAAAEGSFFEGKISMAAGRGTRGVVTYREKRTGENGDAAAAPEPPEGAGGGKGSD